MKKFFINIIGVALCAITLMAYQLKKWECAKLEKENKNLHKEKLHLYYRVSDLEQKILLHED